MEKKEEIRKKSYVNAIENPFRIDDSCQSIKSRSTSDSEKYKEIKEIHK